MPMLHKLVTIQNPIHKFTSDCDVGLVLDMQETKELDSKFLHIFTGIFSYLLRIRRNIFENKYSF